MMNVIRKIHLDSFICCNSYSYELMQPVLHPSSLSVPVPSSLQRCLRGLLALEVYSLTSGVTCPLLAALSEKPSEKPAPALSSEHESVMLRY